MNAVSSWRRKFLSLIMAITLVFSIFPASSVFAASELPMDVDFYAATSFQNDLNLVYYCKINTPGDFENLRLCVSFQKFSSASSTCTWEDRIITDYTYDAKTKEYRFVYKGIAASEMSNILKCTLRAELGNQTYASAEKTFSIKQYASKILEKNAGSTSEKDKLMNTLVVDMLNYGAAAQLHFKKNTGSLANSDLTADQKALASTLITDMNSRLRKDEISGASASFTGVALYFGNTVDLVAYATMKTEPKDSIYAEVSYTGYDGSILTSRVNSKNFRYDDSTKEYRIAFNDISAIYFRSQLNIVFKDGDYDISSTLRYSYESYTNDIMSGNHSQTMKDLSQYMLTYGDSAYEYFTYVQGEPEGPTTYVTYSMFKEADDPDDYMSLVRAHAYANEHNLPVKADPGATYVINHMDPSNPKGAIIMTDTDWGDALFEIHDDLMTLDAGDHSSEGECYLFTVAPSKASYKKYMNDGNDIYLGLDPRLEQYPEYRKDVSSSYPGIARQLDFKNKTFTSETTQLDMRPGEEFPTRTLFVLETYSKYRWGRFGSESASDNGGKPQTEIVVVNRDGSIDPTTKLQWDWFNINMVEAYPIDDELLTINGGTFNTYVNVLYSKQYVNRGISIKRSNVLMKGTKHYMKGEDKTFDQFITKGGVKRPKLGAPIQGFFRIDHCTNVTLKDCVFSNHLCAFVYGNTKATSSPYDYYAEFAANLVIDHCVCAPDEDDPSGAGDPTGILDDTRWGTTGTNYCKEITVVNQSRLNRIDAHKGTYNLTVKDSTLGIRSVAAVGFGTMYLENVTVLEAQNFITLRNDYGSVWYGDIYIKNCTWDIGNNYTVDLIQAIYNPNNEYLYEPFTEVKADGTEVTYYGSLPSNIYIDGLTIDARKLVHIYLADGTPYDGPATCFYGQRGLNIYSSILANTDGAEVTEEWLSDPVNYPRPLRVTEKVVLNNLTVIKPQEYANKTLKYVTVRNGDYLQIKDAYFVKDTALEWDGEITYIVADE